MKHPILSPHSSVSSWSTPQTISPLLLIGGCLWMMPHGDFTNPDVFPEFWIGYGLSGLGYALTWRIRTLSPIRFWAIALACRVILLFMHPGDDIWRYLWEGLIQTQGFSPYHLAPNAPELAMLRPDWWSSINHPTVSAIYPPLTQWGFRILAAIAPSVLLFKSAFIAADLAICHLLAQRYGHGRAIEYAWNPIILYSFAGGGHYDSWFLLALVAAWLAFDSGPSQSVGEPDQGEKPRRSLWTYGWSAWWVGVSIAFKWISLPILVFLAWHGACEKRAHHLWRIVAVVALLGSLPMILSTLAFCDSTACPLIPTGSTFVSHGRSAELAPHLVSRAWEAARWDNKIFAIPLVLWVGWLTLRARSLLQFAEWYFFGVFILSPIIHAWYFTWIVPFAVSNRNWGTRFLSLSAATYFVLPYRQSKGDFSWFLRPVERIALWVPFLGGWIRHITLKQQNGPTQNKTLITNSYVSPRSNS